MVEEKGGQGGWGWWWWRVEFVKTDVEQTWNNYESIGSPTRSNSARIPARMNNQIGTSVAHIPRNERRNVNQQRVRFTHLSSPLHRFPLFPSSSSSFLYSFSKRTRATIPRYGRKRSRCCYTFLRVQFDSAPSPDLWWTTCPSPSLESKNRWKGYGETDPFKIPIGILRRNFLGFCNLEIKYLSFLNR